MTEMLGLRGRVLLMVVAAAASCGGASGSEQNDAQARQQQVPTTSGRNDDAGGDGPRAAPATHVFVLAMENESPGGVLGNPKAPYINGVLLPQYATASKFTDELPGLQSEPHYIWMEAGTNAFADHTFQTDDPPSATNSTASPDHLTTQIQMAGHGLSWTAYVEGADLTTQPCPIVGQGTYVPRHDPFLYFKDIAGAPPSKTAGTCAAHHKPLSALAGDLAGGSVAAYVFIAPDLCHDMHGSASCPSGDRVQAGDSWLSNFMPGLITYLDAAGGVVFIVWDEATTAPFLMPFLAVGPGVKAGYSSAVTLNHGSLLKSAEEMLRLPILSTVQNVPDLGDLFVAGAVP